MQSRMVRRLALAVGAVAMAVGLLAATGFGQSKPDPVSAARFALTVDNNELASFSELSGIQSEIKPVDYIQSDDKSVQFKKLPGQAKPATVTLKRGLNSGLELWSWHEAALRGSSSARKSVSLIMFGADGKPVSRYYLENAWPSKLEISGIKAGSSEALFESVTLVAEHIQRVAP